MAFGDLTTLANVKQWLGLTGLAIAGISQASPAVVTLQTRPSTPLLSGVVYHIEGATGIALPAGDYVITVIDPLTFSIPYDTQSSAPYTGGAVVSITDPLLSRLITACSTFIQSWLNRTIARMSYIEVHNGTGGQIMLTKQSPISAVSSLIVDGLPIPARAPLGLSMSSSFPYGFGYVFDENALMVSGLHFTRGFQNVEIMYTAGYSATPTDIEQAAIDMIGDWFKYIDRVGKLSQSIEAQSTTFVNTPIPARALGVLQQYKKIAPI